MLRMTALSMPKERPAILDSFCNVDRQDFLTLCQVGNGSGNFQNPVGAAATPPKMRGNLSEVGSSLWV
jgi:hypothetical protein